MSEIYTHYTIPNNQIVYTMLLKVWENIVDWGALDVVLLWRVLALLCALLIVVKHAENIVRLIGGTESKLQIGGRRPARDEDFTDPD